jgi:hypothetical protein
MSSDRSELRKLYNQMATMGVPISPIVRHTSMMHDYREALMRRNYGVNHMVNHPMPDRKDDKLTIGIKEIASDVLYVERQHYSICVFVESEAALFDVSEKLEEIMKFAAGYGYNEVQFEVG